MAPELATATKAQPHLFDCAMAYRARHPARWQGAVDQTSAAHLDQQSDLGSVGRQRVKPGLDVSGLPGHRG